MRDNTYISVSIVSDSKIKELNKKHLKRDYATDVLSFNMDEDRNGDEYYLGDVIVNFDQAKRQAKDYGNTFEEEVAALVEHGVLHLLGVHHDGDEE